MNLACPKCTSTEVRKLSLIYNEGLSTINTVSQGTGVAMGSGGGMAFGSSSSHTTGRQQTALSKQASPPDKKHWILWTIGRPDLRDDGPERAVASRDRELSCLPGSRGSGGEVRACRGRSYNAEVHPGLMQQLGAVVDVQPVR